MLIRFFACLQAKLDREQCTLDRATRVVGARDDCGCSMKACSPLRGPPRARDGAKLKVRPGATPGSGVEGMGPLR